MHERLHVLGVLASRAREPQRVLPVQLRRPLTRLVVCGIGGIDGKGALLALAFHSWKETLVRGYPRKAENRTGRKYRV